MSFANAARRREAAGWRYVTATANGRPAWYVLKLNKLKAPLYDETVRRGNGDLAHFGEVVYSGWGAEPPLDVQLKLLKLFAA